MYLKGRVYRQRRLHGSLKKRPDEPLSLKARRLIREVASSIRSNFKVQPYAGTSNSRCYTVFALDEALAC